MAGYRGYSMSNNAVAAYSDGEKPLSKWTKEAILYEIKQDIIDEQEDLDIGLISKLTKSELCDLFLIKSSWHHTSKMYNRTDFYSVSNGNVTNQKVLYVLENREPKEKKAKIPLEKPYYAEIEYGEWGGTARHRKLVTLQAQAVIQGNNVYLLPYGERKLLTGKHLRILKQFQRKPKTFDTQAVENIKKRCIRT